MESTKMIPHLMTLIFVSFLCQTDAQDICRKKEGDLFSINSHEEFLSVFSFFVSDSKKQNYSSIVFIGLMWDNKVNSSKVLNESCTTFFATRPM